jgi:hypothetical protein
MLFWENSSWRQIAISAGPILLTIDGENSSYKIMDGETGLSCSPADAFTSCLTEFPVEHILMDTATGRMGISGLFGALRTKTESRNFVSTQVYNCTKF